MRCRPSRRCLPRPTRLSILVSLYRNRVILLMLAWIRPARCKGLCVEIQSQEGFPMRSLRLILIVFSVVWLCMCTSVSAGDEIKFRSPNGKFAMRLAGDISEIIDLKAGKTVLELEEVSGSWAKGSKLLWSPDSKYFAHFSADRRGGSTTIYRQKGDTEFEQVPLPEFPDCEKTNV